MSAFLEVALRVAPYAAGFLVALIPFGAYRRSRAHPRGHYRRERR